MSNNIYIGIDPGQSGGIARIVSDGKPVVWPMPVTTKDLWEILHVGCIQPEYKTIVFIEKVHSMPGQGVASTFKFGVNYGKLLGMLAALSVRYEEIPPRTWQKGLGIPPRDKARNESKTAFKNRLKAKAQQLYPNIKFTLKTCDAMLIAEYCKRMNP